MGAARPFRRSGIAAMFPHVRWQHLEAVGASPGHEPGAQLCAPAALPSSREVNGIFVVLCPAGNPSRSTATLLCPMARSLRIAFPGACHHVTTRANERQAIFRDTQDRERFLARPEAARRRYGLALHAYV